MSIVKIFLKKSVIVTGLMSVSLISAPIIQSAEAAGQVRSRVIGNNNNVVINNRGGGRQFNNRGRGRSRGGIGTGGAVALGLVGGAILYSAMNNNNRGYNRGYRNDRYYNRGYNRGGHVSTSITYSNYGYGNYGYRGPRNYGYRSRGYGYAQPYGYNPRPRTRVVYVESAPQTIVQQVPVYTQAPAAPVYQQQQQAQNSSCLQSREYTTTIEIGGETVPAYGQACLQQDGSWKFGDPVAVPNF